MAIVTTSTTQLTCDRDGVTATSTSPEPTLPAGWVALSDMAQSAPPILLCPACAGAFDTFVKSATQGGSP